MGEIDFPQCTSERLANRYRVGRHLAAAWPRRRFDGNPIFCSLLVVADRRHPLDRGAGPH
jgi:hypothetical protein